jgi:LDH2 family malate/lactate/ureidoglycolate dehydrogenase
MSVLSHIAAVIAGLALVTTGTVVFPESRTRGLAKGLAFSVMLTMLAAALIGFARNFGS